MSATGRANHKRNPFDAYSTPTWCTEAIAKEIVWGYGPEVLEPATGERAIAEVIEWYMEINHGILHEGDINATPSHDFLTDFDAGRYDFVITNPPFSLAQEFVEKALSLSNCTVMLLRLNFLASKSRKEFWQKHPPTAIHILTKRPSFSGKGTDATDYGWFVWDSTGRQKVGLYWI